MIIANILGILVLLFFLWRRLKEDYHFERVFSLGFFVLFGILVGFLISLWFLKDFWFWVVLTGALGGYLIGCFRQRMNFFESFEALIIGSLSWLALIYLSDSIANSSLYSFLAFWVSLCLIALFFFLDSNYKKFTWYKSGRVGFAGLSVGIAFFLIRTVIAIFDLPVISFLGQGEWIVSGLTSLLFMVLLYNLSKQ